MTTRDELRPGAVLKNDGLMALFDVGIMGGMRRSVRKGHIVIVSDHTRSLYDDRWVGEILHYTGMGKTGDQQLRDQNRTLAEADQTGVQVYLFEVFQQGSYIFRGQVTLCAEPYQEDQLDQHQALRKVWMFPLRLVEGNTPPTTSTT